MPLRERAAQQVRGAGFTRELSGCQQAAGGIEGERCLQTGKTQVVQHNVGATDARPVVQQQVFAGQQQWSLLGRDGDGGRAGDRCRRRQAQQANAHGEAGSQGDGRSGKAQAHDAVRLPRPGADLRRIAKGPQVIEIGRPGLALAFAPRGGFCRLTLARGRLQPGPDAGIHGFEPGFVGEFDGCALNGLLFHLAALGGLFFQFGLQPCFVARLLQLAARGFCRLFAFAAGVLDLDPGGKLLRPALFLLALGCLFRSQTFAFCRLPPGLFSPLRLDSRLFLPRRFPTGLFLRLQSCLFRSLRLDPFALCSLPLRPCHLEAQPFFGLAPGLLRAFHLEALAPLGFQSFMFRLGDRLPVQLPGPG